MKKQFTIEGIIVTVDFFDRGLQLKGDRNLWLLMDRDPVKNAHRITEKVLEFYPLHYGRKLKIRADSIIVEIWGHVYAEYFVLLWRDRLGFRWLNRLCRFVRTKSAEIDIGEWGADANRWFWDVIAVLKPIISFFLPRNISRKTASGGIP